MNEQLKTLASDSGFIESFWKLIRENRENGKAYSHKAAYELLNQQYEEMTGRPRFPSFDAFRMFRDRKYKRSKK